MYTGTVISDLMNMVARVEENAQQQMAAELESEDRLLASHFAYHSPDAQPMMAGVA
jgi:hypothetical protein